MKNLRQHLLDRDFLLDDPYFPAYIGENTVSFPLYNLSGKLVGFHYYNPIGYKGTNSQKAEIKKYITEVTRENDNPKVRHLAVYGLHTLDKRPFVFIVEGVFDAVKLMRFRYPVLVVFTNDPKPLRNFFYILGKRIIVIADNDVKGRQLNDLKKMSDEIHHVSDKYGDLGNMPLEKVSRFIQKILK